MAKELNSKELFGKTVLVRCDYNVPLDENGNIVSAGRIQSSTQTINELLKANCKVILCSHMGRPKGKVDKALSLKCVADYLSNIYPNIVHFCSKLTEKDITKAKKSLKNSEILLLENLRFDLGEEQNSEDFAKMLSIGVDAFVDEAFATSHRECASNNAILKFLPSYYGVNYLKEIKELTFKGKTKPYMALLGGAKVSDKIDLIENLIDIVDEIFIGGALANTFLYALNYSINPSIVELDKVDMAKTLIKKCEKQNKSLILPLDLVVLDQNGKVKNRTITDVKPTDLCYDVGEKTIKQVAKMVSKKQGTIFWNGPFGKITDERFCGGTKGIAEALAKSKCYTIVGGGDSEGFLKKYNLHDKMNFVSTGGGASLKYIQRG